MVAAVAQGHGLERCTPTAGCPDPEWLVALDERIKTADQGTGAAEHQAEADDPVARGADAEVHHVFHQDVARVLGTGKAGFTQGKTRLHEVDQERTYQRPTGVDGTEHNSHTSPQVV